MDARAYGEQKAHDGSSPKASSAPLNAPERTDLDQGVGGERGLAAERGIEAAIA